jgi:cbb3-type cytochrome oxidase subunit 3
MITDSFRSIFHVEIYALIGFLIFFTFFILVTIHTFRMKNEDIAEMSNLPFDDSNELNNLTK